MYRPPPQLEPIGKFRGKIGALSGYSSPKNPQDFLATFGATKKEPKIPFLDEKGFLEKIGKKFALIRW